MSMHLFIIVLFIVSLFSLHNSEAVVEKSKSYENKVGYQEMPVGTQDEVRDPRREISDETGREDFPSQQQEE